MMKVIFESETEVGKCDWPGTFGNAAREGKAALFAHTQASLNGSRGMLKIEQHCYIRDGAELPEQPRFQPEITFEPALESKPQMIALAKNMHQQFVERVRKDFLHRFAA